jgi:hypothetical protein
MQDKEKIIFLEEQKISNFYLFVVFFFSLGASDRCPRPTANPTCLPAADTVLLDFTISLGGAEHGKTDRLLKKFAAKHLVLFSIGSVGIEILCSDCRPNFHLIQSD